MEEWRDIEGYEDLYQVSDAGRIRSKWIPSVHSDCEKRISHITRILKPVKNNNGYYKVTLCDSDGMRTDRSIHRLVAEAFIPNEDNKPQINHKNGDKYDNGVENLEWCTSKENNSHASVHGLKPRPNNARKVLRSDGQIFNSAAEAGRAIGSTNGSHVSDVCNGKRTQAGGYHYRYID